MAMDFKIGEEVSLKSQKVFLDHSFKYFMRHGHRDTNNDRDTENINDDRDTENINDDRDTGTQLQRGRQGAQGGYINDDRDTGNVRREITDRDTGTQMTTGIPGHGEYK